MRETMQSMDKTQASEKRERLQTPTPDVSEFTHGRGNLLQPLVKKTASKAGLDCG